MSDEGPHLSASSVGAISKAPHVAMICRTHGESSIVKAVRVSIAGREYLADKVTGGLYEPDTGRCLSSSARQLEGPAPDGYKLPEKAGAFPFGTQPISTKPKEEPKPKLGRGKLCGEDKGGAKLTEADVLKIRARVPGTTHYVMTVSAAAKLFGVGPSTVVSARKRKTWRHLP